MTATRQLTLGIITVKEFLLQCSHSTETYLRQEINWHNNIEQDENMQASDQEDENMQANDLQDDENMQANVHQDDENQQDNDNNESDVIVYDQIEPLQHVVNVIENDSNPDDSVYFPFLRPGVRRIERNDSDESVANDAQLNDQDSDDSVFPFRFVPMRRANVLNDHSGDEIIHPDENEEPRQEEYQWNEQDFIIAEELDPDVIFMMELDNRRRMAEIEDLPFVQVQPVSDSETIGNFDNICVVCCDSIRTHAFIPCGHRPVCGDCVVLLNPERCPLCNQPFTTYIRIWS
ncbi:unnamed protein product [Macrosiphum euphorbiae]|nr:unnamed protein product [Macrosiphum euphorbiae]